MRKRLCRSFSFYIVVGSEERRGLLLHESNCDGLGCSSTTEFFFSLFSKWVRIFSLRTPLAVAVSVTFSFIDCRKKDRISIDGLLF